MIGVAVLTVAGLAFAAYASSRGAGPTDGTASVTRPASNAEAARAVGSGFPAQEENVQYDGRFTFVRLKFIPSSSLEGMGGGRRGGPDLKWDHDYPRAEQHLMKILEETTLIRPYLDGGNIFATDDPELLKYPVAYLSEPGFWTMTESEVDGLRNYLHKGGFLIADDFRGQDWTTFYTQIRRVLPDAQLIELDESAPIFNSFFEIESLDINAPYGQRFKPTYFGIYEDNDSAKRLMVIANYNNDLGDNWEWSDTGFLPVQVTNQAYKLGVNYIVYAMTH